MGGRRTGVLTIGSSEGIALGNGGPLRLGHGAENIVGTATTLACLVTNPLPLCRRCLLTLALWQRCFGCFMSFDISASILPARVLPTRLYMFWCCQDGNVARHEEFKSDTSNMEMPMRKSMTSLLLLAAVIPASAQTASPPPNRDANTPAVNSPNSPPNPGAPVAGANSFTEGQAKSRIEGKGLQQRARP